MPTIVSAPTHPPTTAEWPAFRAWATSRPGYRPDATEHRIRGLDGAFILARRPQTLELLVGHWRSLGRPAPPTRRSPQPGPRPPRNGKGAVLGAARRAGGC